MPKYTARKVDRGGSPAQVTLLEGQLRRVRALEDSSLEYQEMLVAAAETVRSRDALPKQGNGRVVEL